MKTSAFKMDQDILAMKAAQAFRSAYRLAYAYVDHDLVIQQTSPNFMAMVGGEDSPDGVLIAEALWVFAGLEGTLQDVLAGKLPSYTLEYIRYEQAQNVEKYFDFLISPIDESVPERGLLILIADATEQGGLRQKIIQERNELRLIRGRLAKTNAQLASTNAELEAFAHTVAHDLKNPLTTLIGSSDLLLQNKDKLSDQQEEQLLLFITNTGHRMVAIVDDLLLLSSTHDMKKVEMGPLDMRSPLNGTLQRLDRMIARYEATIIIPDEFPVAIGYEPWVEAVWTNYISNAIKYGGRPPRVAVGASAEGNGFVRFWVRDNGNGLTVEEQERLFMPFERLSQTINLEGHGLGLSIVQRIIVRLGGNVGVESDAKGSGSLFYFTLPCA